MNFFHSGHLWLAALAAIPLILHLIHRVKPPRVNFALFRLLLEAQRQARRGLKLERLLLLALRIGLILLLAGWAARPFHYSLPGSGGQPGHYLLLLDDSFSMRVDQDGISCFKRARDEARKFLTGLSETDRVCWLRRADDEPVWESPASVSQAMSEKEAGWGTWPARDLMKSANQIMEPLSGVRQILLLTDFQAVSFAGEFPEPSPGITLSRFDARIPGQLPVQIRPGKAVFQPDEPAVNLPCRLTIPLHGPAGRTARYSIHVGGREMQQRDVVLDDQGNGRVIFDLEFQEEGIADCEVRRVAGTDSLSGDDGLFLTPRIQAELYGLLIRNSGEGSGFYVGAALSPSPGGGGDGVRLLQASPSGIPESLDPFDFLVLDSPPADPRLAEQVAGFLDSGGHAMLFVEQITDLAEFSRVWRDVLPAPVAGLPPAVDDNRSVLKIVDYDSTHPLFVRYSDPRFSLEDFRFFRCVQLVMDDLLRNSRVLASFAPGLPALVERRLGEGSLYLFTAGLQRQDSDAPFSVQFVPFIQEMKRVLRRQNGLLSATSVHVGGKPRIRLAANKLDAALLSDPRGRSLPLETHVAGNGLEFTGSPLEEPGFYRVAMRSGGRELELKLACNVDPRESELTYVVPQPSADKPMLTLSRTVPVEWAWLLLYLFAALLLGESLLTWRLDEDAL